jgi:2'-5' RNA ligase
MTGGPARTALVVVTGEAESAVGPWRRRFDAEAVARRIPAHVTIVFPFVRSHAVDADLLARLRALYAPVAPFDYALAVIRRFPAIAWLAPDPATSFVSLTERTYAAFPDYPPYGDPSLDPVPHCSIGVVDEPESLDAIVRELERGLERVLPIRCTADEITLLEERPDGRWSTRATFPLHRT